ncbi:MAG: DUF4386 family protein [Rhodobacter sp.]|nr:DUF4386 family protein [Rhodobacter sp.]MCA3511779.1 DUF4386 family protein [Rhodobacter sp.]MCA3521225.1 DUF4386 family protein [Rhodobacter sp.]MCA3522240.1 DUF4386 family protein [Rhodobacter sp.]MCA3526816.1 DUF4386 family protein [Rhodobacter sp.]
MSPASSRIVGYAVVTAGFLTLAYGLTMLSAVLNFLGLDGASLSTVADFVARNSTALHLSLVSTMVGYVLAVPMMLIITEAAFGGQTDQPRRKSFALGLVWASLPLRPLWWLAIITLLPTLMAVSGPEADPATAVATFTGYQMLTAFLNAVTEDIAVNILGGGWFVIVGLAIVARRSMPALLGWIGCVIGAFYLVSSGEIFGFAFGAAGGFIPVLVGPAGVFWLGAAGFLAVRRVF